MTPSRREFLKIAGATTLSLIVPELVVPSWAKEKTPALKTKRWAMAVNSAKCPPGCVDCIIACHETHNVPDFGNPKDEIKWIWKEPFTSAFPDESHPRLRESIQKNRLPILCNHCANPPCVRVCPTKATFQRPDGIVMMDYHRCIGCRFCMAACPYGARSMNYREPRPFLKKINPDFPTRTKGVVEKCNFCEERLVRGLFPACVTACKKKALVFGDTENPQSEIRQHLGNNFTMLRRPALGTKPQVYYIV